MSNKSNGEVAWGDVSFPSNTGKTGKDTFLRLAPGSNVVRLLTLPHQYYQHKYVVDGGKQYGYRINCSASTGSCPLCEKGDKAKRRWFLGVIDRKTNAYRILDIGFAVFKSISTYAKDNDWGDPSQYDLDIVVDPNGGATGYYTVVSKPKRALSAADLVIREENDVEELVRRTQAPTAEKVRERLTAIEAEIAGGVSETAATSETSSDDEDGEDAPKNIFNDYDAQPKAASKSVSKVAPF